ncbi:hypothetical protein [uncultured Sphingomonas sp.]|uniref:hypothetical protein n=1 Tax=uncultured Sphingomonas sp. TaxID=158754 RepID=UPI0026168249|nr:hypothetical protein [uncultured Sphingomonas sp.]
MRVFDVFTPTGVPTYTYVDRSAHNLEEQLRNAIRTPGMIAALSGPSKSGKTVLIRKVIDADNLITVSGAAITDPTHLWERVLNWMEAPSSTTHTIGNTFSGELTGKAQAAAGIVIAKAQVEAEGKAGYEHERAKERVFERAGIDQVVREIGGSDFVVFVDDYHYMPKDVQVAVGRQIKEAAERGINICTASVPHRKDDVVRGNAELRGRVQGIDFEYWSTADIREIAEQGFDILGVRLPEFALDRMADEAFGSPQLMQQICLQACMRLGIDGQSEPTRDVPVSEGDLTKVFEQASTTTDFSSLLEGLHEGPKQRGSTRNQFAFTDGTQGDVYRCILLALRQSPPRLSFPYAEIYDRTRAVCVKEAPPGSSIASALDQMPEIASDLEPNAPIIEWGDDVLDIVDPYFLYYLRCSPRLMSLAKS